MGDHGSTQPPAPDVPHPAPEPPESLESWADLLEAACARAPALGLRHVRVLAETASTQDAAYLASGAHPGWLVIAGRQTAGRGRLGRDWADDHSRGLAMTLTLPAGSLSSVAAGLAVCRAADALLPRPLLGLRWPNDVVERAASGRKLAGVLIEARDGVALVGIGLNVAQRDWPAELAARAVSLRQLGSAASRIEAACAVVAELERISGLSPTEIARLATGLDTLRGTTRRFKSGANVYEGVVESIRPDAAIRLRTPAGDVIQLPAHTTTLLHE